MWTPNLSLQLTGRAVRLLFTINAFQTQSSGGFGRYLVALSASGLATLIYMIDNGKRQILSVPPNDLGT